ncbi:MAG: carbonic anhydrase family protein [Acidimicrobiia bacterium]|nr:carbonic anhydrase family protein [Acidimicrobiia bacterium]
MQSPIALDRSRADTAIVHASTSYHHMSTVTLVDVGNTARARPEPGGVLDLDGVQYTLDEIHGHTPSEHTIDGRAADLEVHLVHRSADGAIAVVGVLFETTDGVYPVDTFITNIGGLPTMVHLDHLVPGPPSPMFRYQGSLTTPPYTEGVEWVVHTKRGSVGTEALTEFASRYGSNNRAIQSAGDGSVRFG